MQDSLFNHYQFVVNEEQVLMRLDHFLSFHLSDVSRTRIQSAIKSGNVYINNHKIAKNSHLVKEKDLLKVILPVRERLTKIEGENIPLEIVYEDKDLLVLNKEAEMVVHPGAGNWSGTLVHSLVYRFKDLPSLSGNEGRPGLVHRIDKGTSGLMVVAKSEQALTGLAKQFAEHSVDRCYSALVWGNVEKDEGIIRTRLARSQGDRRLMSVYPSEGTHGKEAITHYRVEERLGYVTFISCRLETGRTHQIRAHMRHLGHPLFGDVRYGGAKLIGPPFAKYRSFVLKNLTLLSHQALHAGTLGFVHPCKGNKINFSATLPSAFSQVLKRWRKLYTSRGI